MRRRGAPAALEFSRAHPDTSPSYATTLPRLEERLNRAEQYALQQRDGFLKVRAATALKSELRRTLSSVQLNHLADVASLAATESPDLARKFVLAQDTRSYLAFRTAARGMAAEALNRKDVLLKYGLAEEVLESLVPLLDQFDGGSAARRLGGSAARRLGRSRCHSEGARRVRNLLKPTPKPG